MEKKLILVVEDDHEIVDLLKDILKSFGFDVAVAYNGEEALRVMEKRLPNLILLDIVLPGKNGYTVLREIRRREENFSTSHHIPVVMQSGRGLPTRILCESEGIAGFLHKPYGPDELRETILSALEEDAA